MGRGADGDALRLCGARGDGRLRSASRVADIRRQGRDHPCPAGFVPRGEGGCRAARRRKGDRRARGAALASAGPARRARRGLSDGCGRRGGVAGHAGERGGRAPPRRAAREPRSSDRVRPRPPARRSLVRPAGSEGVAVRGRDRGDRREQAWQHAVDRGGGRGCARGARRGMPRSRSSRPTRASSCRSRSSVSS